MWFERMNMADKVVFSGPMKHADWENTKVISGDLIEEIKKLKQEALKDMTILGSGSIIAQLAAHKLIDEYKIMIDPLAIGEGTPLFNDMKDQLDLKLISGRTFKSGTLLLKYRSK